MTRLLSSSRFVLLQQLIRVCVVCTVGFGLLLSSLPVQAAEAAGDTKGTDLKSSGGSASKEIVVCCTTGA